MEIVWASKKPLTVRETYETLKKNKKIAYTTVMTIMDRLFEKQLLNRDTKKSRGGIRYVYWPALERQNYQESAVHEVLSSLLSNFSETVANFIIEKTTLSEEDRKLLKNQLSAKTAKNQNECPK